MKYIDLIKKYWWIVVIISIIIYRNIKHNTDNSNDFVPLMQEYYDSNVERKPIDKILSEKPFIPNFDSLDIDTQFINNISGTWIIDNISEPNIRLNFSVLNKHDSLIFKNTPSTIITSWGKIQHNNELTIYFSKSGSYVYEYLILNDDILRIIWFEQHDSNMKLLKDLKYINFDFHIKSYSDNILVLERIDKGEKIKLIRKNN